MLCKVVERATSYNLKLNFNKSNICQSSVPYIGRLITADGLKPKPTKVEAIQSMAPSLDKEGIKRFFCFITYLLKSIPNLGEVDMPQRQLLKRDVEFVWQPAQHVHACTKFHNDIFGTQQDMGANENSIAH